MKTRNKKTRAYRKITAATVAKHKAAAALIGNGTAAVITTDPDYQAPHQRAYRIVKKSENMPTTQYLNDSMEQIASEAIQELGELIHSPDEKIKGVNVRYAIDQVRGKAVTKSISLVGKTNIQSVLD